MPASSETQAVVPRTELRVPQPFIIKPNITEQLAALRQEHTEVKDMFTAYQNSVASNMNTIVQLTAKEVR